MPLTKIQRNEPYIIPYFSEQLCDDLIWEIVKYLPVIDLLHTGETCKKLCRLTLHNYVWKLRFQSDYPRKYKNVLPGFQENPGKSWLNAYRENFALTCNILKNAVSSKRFRLEDKSNDDEFKNKDCLNIINEKILIDVTRFGNIRVVDLERMLGVKTLSETEIPFHAIYADENFLYIGFDSGAIKIWNLKNGIFAGDTGKIFLSGELSKVEFLTIYQKQFICVFNNGKILIVANKINHFFDLFSDAKNEVKSVSLHDGKLYVSSSIEGVVIWDLSTKTIVKLQQPIQGLFRELIVQNEKIIGIPYPGFSLAFFEARTGNNYCTIQEDLISAFEVIDHLLIFATSKGSIHIWDYVEGTSLCSWQAYQGEELRVLSMTMKVLNDAFIVTAATVDEPLADPMSHIKIWDLHGKLISEKELDDKDYLIERLAISNGKVFFSFREDFMELWDFEKGHKNP